MLTECLDHVAADLPFVHFVRAVDQALRAHLRIPGGQRRILRKAERAVELDCGVEHMVHHVIDTAIQLHGALGFSQDTILAKWYTQVRSQRLVDGPDEVHKWKVGRNVIKAFREHGTTASAAGGDLL